MARAVLAQLVLLLSTVAQAGEFYVFTNRYDDMQVSQAWEDKQFAVGAVTTSAVSPLAVASPLTEQFENGIALLDEAGHWWKPVVIDGQIDPIQISNSPLEDSVASAMEAAGRAEIKAARSNRLTRIEKIAVDLQQVDAQIERTNWVDVVLTGITVNQATWPDANQRATIAAIKAALQATKDREQNAKVAIRNLMQATEKVRKEIE